MITQKMVDDAMAELRIIWLNRSDQGNMRESAIYKVLVQCRGSTEPQWICLSCGRIYDSEKIRNECKCRHL